MNCRKASLSNHHSNWLEQPPQRCVPCLLLWYPQCLAHRFSALFKLLHLVYLILCLADSVHFLSCYVLCISFYALQRGTTDAKMKVPSTSYAEKPQLSKIPSFSLQVSQKTALYALPAARNFAFLIFGFPFHAASFHLTPKQSLHHRKHNYLL